MIRKLFAIMLALCAMTFASGLVENTLTEAGTEQSLSSLTTNYQGGANTYVTFSSNESADAGNITLNYMTSAYVLKSATLAINGNTTVNTSVGQNYVFDIPASATTFRAIKMDVDNYTLTSNGKNSSLRCANYTNVYHVEGTAVKFTTNTVASSASALLDYVDADRLAHLYNMNFSNMTTVLDTYFSTIWYYYNPPLTQNVYVNSVDNVLPQGQQFLATTAFAVSGASTNLNNSWANNSNHSQGYVNGVITVRPNADLRSFNVTSNETYPVLAYGYVIIPSARLVQNQRVIVSDLETSKCVNATLKHTGLTNVTTSYYSDTGAITAPVTDIAYLYGVTLSGAQTGEVNVSDNAGTLLYTVAAGRTIPIDNGGSQMCLNSNGCTITNLMYGGDALWKLSVRVIGASANTTKMAVYQAAGSSVFGFGQNVIHWNAGQRLAFFGKGYVNSTNVSIYYEGG